MQQFWRQPALAALALLSIAWATAAPGQEESAAPAATAKTKFDAKFAEYKARLRQIEELRSEFQVAEETERPQLNDQLSQLVGETQPIVDELVELGTSAYRENPADKEIESFLSAVAKHLVPGTVLQGAGGAHHGGDRYEQSLPVIEALIAGNASEPLLPVWGVVAAFASNQYELAEEYFQLAKERGALADPASLKDEAEKRSMGLALQFAQSISDYRELWQNEEQIRAAEAAADDLPRVRLTTSKGDIVLELFENEAPQAVANFLSLVKKGFYSDVPFHRVLPGFMAQGGDPTGTGGGGPGYAIRCECYQPNARQHFRGSLSMAHSGRDTGGSQFFLTFVPTSHLNGRHTAFGRVVEGMDVLGELQRIDPEASGQKPTPDKILEAEVIRDRGHAFDFEKLPGR